MEEFKFPLDKESYRYCLEIVDEMIRQFGISKEEAIGRINHEWSGAEFIGDDHVYYHEDPDEWAKDIFYGKDSFWWKNPPNLKPKTFKIK
jgi:hypothetical protein